VIFQSSKSNLMRGITHIIFLILSGSILIVCSCKPKYRQQDRPLNQSMTDQESIYRSNQLMVRQYADAIRDHAASQKWILKETGTGVFFQIINQKKNHSEKIASGDWVSLNYRLSLLNGTECYTSKLKGKKQFVVGRSEAEQGLHDAIQFLCPGDSAIIVIPPQRAFGLTGDGDRIPPRAILVYEIKVDSVSRRPNH